MFTKARLKIILPLLALVLFGIFYYTRYIVAPDIKASDVEITNFLEERTSLETLEGKVIVFNVWATWCPPCVQEMPMFDHLFKEMEGKPVEFILASDEEIWKLVKFTKSRALTVPLYHLPYNMNDLGVYTIPSTFIFDKKGKLIHKKTGAFESAEELKMLIEPLL
jgi:thiol-disulfide isomerase/thioredoxin